MKSWLKWEVTVAEEEKKPVDDRGEATARRKQLLAVAKEISTVATGLSKPDIISME